MKTLNRYTFLPAACALATVLIGLFVACWAHQQQQDHQAETLDTIKSEIMTVMSDRMRDHELILKGARGFVRNSETLTREEWRDYYSNLELDRNYAGILGLGYSQVIEPSELASFEATVRDEGFRSFSVHPKGDRPLYTSILYLEPFSGRNLAAFGYDMMSQSTRAEAMQRAVNHGAAAMSSRVTLLQETDADVQAGMLIYAPVFEKGFTTSSPEERWKALLGFVYSPYRMGDLMKGVGLRDESLVGFEIHDGMTPSDTALMFSSFSKEAKASGELKNQGHVYLEFFGRTWTVSFYSTPAFEEQINALPIVIIILVTLVLATAIFLTMTTIIHRKRRAEELAADMTAELNVHQQELLRIKEKQERVLAGSNDGWWEYDFSTEELFCSDRWWRQLGYAPAHQSNTIAAFRARLPDEEKDRVFEILKTLVRSDETEFTFELTLKHRDGHCIPFMVRGVIERGSDGKAQVISGANTDLSETKRVEAMKNNFVSTVSHELRTPLTSISGSLGLITGGALGEAPAPMQAMLDVAKTNCDRLGLLINDLLDMDKLVAGKMTFSIESHSVAGLIQKSVTANQGYAEKFSVSVEYAAPEGLRVDVDELRFQQILSNLLSNAIKFSPEHGTVVINALPSPQTSVRARIEIIDQGKGIPKEFHPYIFQKFSQADTSTTRERVGTGLGLAITRELAERMDGAVGFSSREGQGSTFWVDVPLSASSTPPRPA
ncbi:CHASE domain-containing sensor histidine kinase [Larsenimonas suaedae]|uniref:histidine kinase n=1 Tax=Larsenimonas suaedae TaxID=1851019 RepID=A0ABU1GSG3_9GAMM|nr:CHASE domain-containing protein [Larsenimonas suaedae]MCM2972429.1 CHASE domain-containing protein [Larsenimonas suaedae]MDR5894775.1 CHASE domain-containing protein [Larsenimonas suaedae]